MVIANTLLYQFKVDSTHCLWYSAFVGMLSAFSPAFIRSLPSLSLIHSSKWKIRYCMITCSLMGFILCEKDFAEWFLRKMSAPEKCSGSSENIIRFREFYWRVYSTCNHTYTDSILSSPSFAKHKPPLSTSKFQNLILITPTTSTHGSFCLKEDKSCSFHDESGIFRFKDLY